MRHVEVIDERFVLEELAGKGGMGSVYRALDQATGELVALKLLKEHAPDTAARFAHEARVLAELGHPYIVRYIAHGVSTTGKPYIAMEWLEGEDLSARLQRQSLRLEESVALIRRVAEALGIAHGRGIVHRDVKPSNIFLVKGEIERVKILDFGIARVLEAPYRFTRTGNVLGTPGYMAPEQARGQREIDASADVFSMGTLLFECLTGRPVFEGSHVMALLAKLLTEEAPRAREIVPNLPEPLDDLLARMLAREPAERLANGAEVARAIEALEPLCDLERLPHNAPREVITDSEQRLLSLVVITPRAPCSGAAPDDATMPLELGAASVEQVRAVVGPLGGRVENLMGSALLVILTGSVSATDLSVQAARCALRLRALLENAVMVLVSGRGEARGSLPVGSIFERSAALLESAGKRASYEAREEVPIWLDEVTRTLLDGRFDIQADEGTFLLLGERDLEADARRLLGKPTPCVGRDRELYTLHETLESSFEDQAGARAVLVTAPPGIGKSRLRQEILRKIRSERPNLGVGIGRGDAMSAGSAYAILRSALLGVVGLVGSESAVSARARLLAWVGAMVADDSHTRIAVFLGEMVGLAFPAEVEPRLKKARQSAQTMAEEIAAAFIDLCRAICNRRPLLLVLEDLHWGDGASNRLIDRALSELADQPFVVLAFARPEVEVVFPDLWKKRNLLSMRLSALPRRAASELVRSALGASISADDTARLVERCEGNAFYLEELIRAFAEGRGESLPETVLGMVEARLAALPLEARRFLRAASVFGEVFWKGSALALLAEPERASAESEWLQWLVENELVARRGDSRFAGEVEYAFRHALLREGSYAMLTDRDRVVGHRLAAEWLQRAGAREDTARSKRGERTTAAVDHYAVIGGHFMRGEAWEEAFDSLDRAGDAASRLLANVEARHHYGAALTALERLPDTDENRRRRIDASIKQVSVSYVVDPIRNIEILSAAEELAEELPEVEEPSSRDRSLLLRVQYWLGLSRYYRGGQREAIGYFKRVLAEAPALGDDVLVALPAGMLGRALAVQGYFAQGAPFIEQSLGPLERAGRWTEWLTNNGYVANTLAIRARREEALGRAKRGVAIALEKNGLTGISVSQIHLSLVQLYLGDPTSAVETARAAVEVAELSGDKVYSYLGYGFGAWAKSRLGLYGEASEDMARVQEIAKSLGQQLFMEDWCCAVEAEIASRAGRCEEALLLAEQAIALAQESENIFVQAIAERAWGQALASADPPRLDEAELHLNESLRLFGEGESLMEMARSYVMLGYLCRARGEEGRAVTHFEQAAEIFERAGAAAELAEMREALGAKR